MCYIGSWVSLAAGCLPCIIPGGLGISMRGLGGHGKPSRTRQSSRHGAAPNSIAQTIKQVGRAGSNERDVQITLLILIVQLHYILYGFVLCCRVSPMSHHRYWRICIGPIECQHVRHDARRDNIRCRTTVFDCSSLPQLVWLAPMYRCPWRDRRCLPVQRRHSCNTINSIRIRITCNRLRHAHRQRRTR